MLTHWAKTRFRLAAIFVAVYAVCVLAPALALVVEGHCLVEDHGMGAHQHATSAHEHHHGDADHTHPHADGAKQAMHHPAEPGASDDGGPAGKCCAVMFLSAIAPELGVTPAPAELSGAAFAGITQSFSGVPPGKLIRPPKLQS